MQFQYTEGTEPTIESAIGQALGAASACWADLEKAGTFQSETAVDVLEATVKEVRRIIASDLTRLLDPEGVAYEWNAAIERAIQVVEGRVLS